MMDTIQQYFDLMKDIKENLLTFIEENDQDTLSIFINYLDEQKITENKKKFESFLYLLVHLSNNYHRTGDLFNKIDRILYNYKESIQKKFQNSEIFHIFQSNKRLLLSLIQSKLITINQSIFDFISQNKLKKKSYIEYFLPEIKSFLPKTLKEEYQSKVKELNENDINQFNQKRKIGENDSYICSLIRNDQVIDFIKYFEKTNMSTSSTIEKSIYETNPLLMNNDSITLIEYSAFFGAQEIFTFLYKKGAKLTSSIWPYIIHGKNSDLIHFLEEEKVDTKSKSYQYLIVEAIKCHHDDIAEYFRNNFCQNEKIYDQYLLKKHLKYYNFNIKIYNTQQIIEILPKSDLFYFFCKYDYPIIVESLLQMPEIDVNYQYSIYKSLPNEDDITLSIAIKNGENEKIQPIKSIEFYIVRRGKIGKHSEYIDECDFDTYRYDLEKVTALHIAARKGNFEIVKLLLHSDKIEIVINSKKYSKSKMFSYFGYITHVDEKPLIHEVIESGYTEILEFLLTKKYVDINETLILTEDFMDFRSTSHMRLENIEYKTALVAAAELGFIEIMKLLLSQKNASINQKSTQIKFNAGGCASYSEKTNKIEKTLLYAAIETGNINIVKFCLDRPEIDVNIPFVMQRFNGDLRRNNQFLLKRDSGKIEEQISPLYLAVSNGNIDIVELLLNQQKIDVNVISIIKPTYYSTEKRNSTALHAAVQNKNTEIIKLLLQQKNIDVNVVDESGKKPIDYADEGKIKKLFLK